MEANYFEPISQKLKSQNVARVIGDLVILNSPNIIRDVRARWLIGESVLGGKIGDYAWSDYRAYKMSLNPSAGGYVDLTLTGALGLGLTVKEQTTTTFKIFSIDSKYEKIGNQYGFEEFGLSDSEWIMMQDEIFQFALETILSKAYE